MTTPEHTLVGIHFAIATGIFHRFGMRSLVFAGLVSSLPDLDGLPMLINMARFESGHRVWGHNVLAIALTSLLVAFLQSRRDFSGIIATLISRRLSTSGRQASETAPPFPVNAFSSIAAFKLSCFCQLLHLPCDMVVSGGHGLSHWPVQPWWPFSTSGFVYPMIPWGDPGPTVILMVGIVAVVRFLPRCRRISATSLLVLVIYLTARRVLSAS